MSIARELARFVTNTSAADLPPLARERARMVIASTIASAAMGSDIVSSQIICGLAVERGGTAEATVWFDGRKLPAPEAARVNATMSDAAASDDSDLRSIAHIGTIVCTTSIATAERTGACGRDVLRAMVLGYEIAGRIDDALTPSRTERGFHGSIATIFGGAVAAGAILALTEAQMTQAIALAATSIGGLMVAAKTELAHTRLSAAFAARDLTREYQALCWGVPNPASGRIVGDIGRDPRERKRMAVVTRNGKQAMTNYRTIRHFRFAAALITCQLETGRTHQIRVHLAHIGHPLIGDPVYLRRRPALASELPQPVRDLALDFPRQALHAETLGFSHPITATPLHFTAPLPADFQALADALQTCA